MTETTRPTTTAGELMTGHHIILRGVTDTLCHVDHVHPYAGRRQVLLLLSEVGDDDAVPFTRIWSAASRVFLGTSEDLAEAKEARRRARSIAGLRALADFFQVNPDMPFARTPTFSHCVLASNDADGVSEVLRIAALLGVEATVEDGSADVEREFEGLRFQAFYVSRRRSADYRALTSYGDNVAAEAEPEPDAVALDVTAGVERAEAVQAEADATEVTHIRQVGAWRHNLCDTVGGEATWPSNATCTDCKRIYRGLPDTDPNVLAAGLPTAEPEHHHVAGTVGGPGEITVVCACGATFAGFDNQVEAMAALKVHIANPVTDVARLLASLAGEPVATEKTIPSGGGTRWTVSGRAGRVCYDTLGNQLALIDAHGDIDSMGREWAREAARAAEAGDDGGMFALLAGHYGRHLASKPEPATEPVDRGVVDPEPTSVALTAPTPSPGATEYAGCGTGRGLCTIDWHNHPKPAATDAPAGE